MAFIEKRKLSNGKTRFDVRWRVYGKARERSFRLRKDAEAWKRKVESEEVAGVAIDPSAGNERFGVYADNWLRTRLVKGRALSPMTVEGYRGLLRRNILPTFGEAPIRKMTVEAVRVWYASVHTKAGADAAAKSYRLLRAIMNTAVHDERIGRNPCRITGGGAEHAAERPMVDMATVWDLADAIDRPLRALVFLAGFGGLRTGEILGLCRSDIDFLRGVVHIRKEAQQVVGAGRIITAPKSEAGRRLVAMPKTVMTELEAHVARFSQAGVDGVVFTAPRGSPMRRRELSDKWRAAVAAVGAPAGLRVHDLRHHAATSIARIPGVTTKEPMARIGHASPRAALIYQHATEERDRALADALDAQIGAAERPAAGAVTALGSASGGDRRKRSRDARGMSDGPATRPGTRNGL